MRLITYAVADEPRVGVVVDQSVVDVTETFPSITALIEGGDAALRQARQLAGEGRASLPVDQVRLLAPIPAPARNVLCVGWNYLKHFVEGAPSRGAQQAEALPEHPTFFSKPPTTVIGPEAHIPYDSRVTTQLDFEAEIALVPGRQGRNIPAASAHAYIFGFMLANDISARDIQRRH